jgi:hypothetical protein
MILLLSNFVKFNFEVYIFFTSHKNKKTLITKAYNNWSLHKNSSHNNTHEINNSLMVKAHWDLNYNKVETWFELKVENNKLEYNKVTIKHNKVKYIKINSYQFVVCTYQ